MANLTGMTREADPTGRASEAHRPDSIQDRRSPADERRVLDVCDEIPSWACRPLDRDGPPRNPAETCAMPPAAANAARIRPSAFAALMTVAEAAAAFRVSTKTIRRLIARGELACVRIGRSIRLRQEDLSYYVTACSDD
jgi:excisionase family DNA binding protein